MLLKNKKIYFNWEDFDNAVDKLAQDIYNSGHKFKFIYGIPRGGLILAVALSHRLNIPLTTELFEGSLIVDEISDTGSTFLSIKDIYKYKTCSIHMKKGTQFITDFYYQDDIQDTDWIVYAWEEKILKQGIHYAAWDTAKLFNEDTYIPAFVLYPFFYIGLLAIIIINKIRGDRDVSMDE